MNIAILIEALGLSQQIIPVGVVPGEAHLPLPRTERSVDSGYWVSNESGRVNVRESEHAVSCEERNRLNQELSMLLDSKASIPKQIAGGVILNPAERRASLVRTNEMIDYVIAFMSEHHKHCSCESLYVQAPPLTGTQGRRQKPMRRTLAAFSNTVRG